MCRANSIAFTENMKIIISEPIGPRGVRELESESGWRVVQLTAEAARNGQLAAELADADGLLVRSAVKVDARLLAAAPRLRVIGRAGIGVDNVDLDAATRQGIVVMNTPGASAISVAELSLALMISLARRIPYADATTRAGQWEKKRLEGSELAGKTLGILGLGRVGLELARRARALEMEIIAYDPYIPPGVAREAAVKLLDFDAVLAASDFLSLHMALTPETQHVLNAQAFQKMKPGLRLVNCARGELIDEAALLAALESGQVAGAGLDVFAQEPPAGSPLLRHPGVIATPHIAGSTHEAQERIGYRIALQIKDYLAHGIIQNAVNVSSLGFEEFKELRPWMDLARKLGSLLVQLHAGAPLELALRYAGDWPESKTELIRNSAIAGLLAQMGHEEANLVNAKSLAEARGISLHEGKWNAPGALTRSLSILLHTEQGDLLLGGTVYHGSAPRLVCMDDIDLDAPMGDYLLVLRNDDVPGVIGHIGTVLGRNGINIASFSLGRQEAGDATHEQKRGERPLRALALVRVDGPVPAQVLEELRQSSSIHLARFVKL